MPKRTTPEQAPPRLHLRLVAPSGDHAALFPTRFRRGVDELRAHGHEVSWDPSIERRRATRTDSAARAASLVEAFEDERVDAVLATIGGTDAFDLLPHLDLGHLASFGKPLVGFSDTNVLQLAGWTAAQLPSIVGPMLLCQFGDERGCDPYTRASFERALLPTHLQRPFELVGPGYELARHEPWGGPDEGQGRHPAPAEPIGVVHKGHGTGTLVATNLAALQQLAGTHLAPELDGRVLFLEASEVQSLTDLRRELVRLRLQGALDGLAALGIGRFTAVSDPGRAALVATLEDLVPSTVPTVIDLPFGHTDPIVSLPLGARCKVSAEGTTSILVTPTSARSSGG